MQGRISFKPTGAIYRRRKRLSMQKINPSNIVDNLAALGYKAKAGTSTDKTTGEITDVVYINGLGSVNAHLDLSQDPAKFGLKVFGNLKEGYAPAVIGEDGKPVRERVSVNGKMEWQTKRGDPLDAEALSRKNVEIAIKARKEITGAVLAAYMLEANGGDMEALKNGFRLQKYERKGKAATAEAGDDIDAADDFDDAARAKPIAGAPVVRTSPTLAR